MNKSKIDNLYSWLNNENGERVCTDLTEEACAHTVKNYFLILLSNMFTKLGDTLSNPKTVLAWLMSYINVPVSLIGFIVPIRESGSMLPQILISTYINRMEIRKWVYVIGTIAQCLAIAGIGFVGLTMQGAAAGWIIILLLVFFSLSRSFCSIVSKDVLGKTIAKTRRGKLKGYTKSVSGILVLAAGLLLVFKARGEGNIYLYSGIMFFASGTWVLASLFYAFITEFKGESINGESGVESLQRKLLMLKEDAHLRKFIISRSLLFCSGLTAPFYILLAQTHVGKEGYLLGLFIISNGLASIISSPFWGKMADVSSRRTMVYAVIIASVLGVSIFLIVTFLPELRDKMWIYPLSVFVLGIAHSGVRLGRKTYVVDMATGSKRTDYVSVSNTAIGIILLFAGGVGALASTFSVEGIILVFSVLGLLGAWSSYQLPEVQPL